MGDHYSDKVGGSDYSPRIILSISEKTNTGGAITYNYALKYKAVSPVDTSSSKDWYLKCEGDYLGRSAAYDGTASRVSIDGYTGTKTIKSGTVTVNRYASEKRTVNWAALLEFKITFSGTYKENLTINYNHEINAKSKYTVSFDDNGGTGGPANQTKVYGETLTISSTKPTRTGFTFKNWKTTRSDGTYYISAGGTTTYNGNQTLVAQWEENKLTMNYYGNYATKAIVDGTTYNSPSGALWTGTVYYNNSYDDAVYNYTSKGNTVYFERTGWEGTGYYNTKSDGSGYSIAQNPGTLTGQGIAEKLGTSLKSASKTVALYAQWKCDTYTVTLNKQDGSGGTSTYYYKYGLGTYYSNSGCTTELSAITKPTRTGYTFGGYYTGTGGSGTQYVTSSGGFTNRICDNAANDTLYAKWTRAVYTVTLNKQNGSGGTSTYYYKYGLGTYYSNSGCTTTLSSVTVPTRTGYTFGGYYTSTGGSGTQYVTSAGAFTNRICDNAASDTLYAKWTVNTISNAVKYNANGGSGTVPASQSGKYDSSITLATPSSLTKTAYTFKEWNTKSDGSGVSYSAGASYKIQSTSSVTLYAIWRLNILTVKYYSNNATYGTLNGEVISGLSADVEKVVLTKTYEYGQTSTDWVYNYTATGNTLYLKKDYYTGTGNYLKGDSSVSIPQVGYSASTQEWAQLWGQDLSAGDVTISIYPQWTQNKLTINYYSNFATGGSFTNVNANKNVLVKTQTYNSQANQPNGVNNYSTSGGAAYMTRTGYSASGYWQTTATGGISIHEDTAFATGQALAGALGKTLKDGNATVNLYPKWEANSYTVTFNGNGGAVPTSSVTVKYDSNIGADQSSNIPTKSGMVFMGWGLSATADPASAIWNEDGYINNDGAYWKNGVWKHLGNVTLYALWDTPENVYKIWFYYSGSLRAKEFIETGVNGTYKMKRGAIVEAPQFIETNEASYSLSATSLSAGNIGEFD